MVKEYLAKLGNTSQITVPREIRQRLDIGPGDMIMYCDLGDRIELLKVKLQTFGQGNLTSRGMSHEVFLC